MDVKKSKQRKKKLCKNSNTLSRKISRRNKQNSLTENIDNITTQTTNQQDDEEKHFPRIFSLTEKSETNLSGSLIAENSAVLSAPSENDENLVLKRRGTCICRSPSEQIADKDVQFYPPQDGDIINDTDQIIETDLIEEAYKDIYDEMAWDTDLEPDDVPQTYDHSGHSAYIECCRHLGVIPASYFLKHMRDKSLNMKHHGLSTNGIKAIAIALVSNAQVVELNLRDNWLNEEGGQALCEMFKENCFISKLDLSGNKLRSDFVEALSMALTSNMTLTHINISGNFIGDRGAEVFATIINNTKKLESVNLSDNELGEYSGIVLGPAISENACIKSLDLSWNSIRRKGAIAVALGIKTNVYLKKINLSWNGFGTEGACALGDALKTNAALEELDISNNRITTEGAVWISKGLVFNDNLTDLKIGQNPMESGGIFAICSAVLKNPSTPLRYLNFEDIEANNDGEKVIKDVKRILPDMVILYGSPDMLRKTRLRIHPMYKFRHYMKKHDLRIVDFFSKFDRDNSLSVSRKEFLQGVMETGIKLTEEELDVLIEELDKDGNGEVNYSELAVGHMDYMDKENRLQSVPQIMVKH